MCERPREIPGVQADRQMPDRQMPGVEEDRQMPWSVGRETDRRPLPLCNRTASLMTCS